jgi:hypothetical protein
MTYVLLFLVLGVIWHFVFESIIAPSIRLDLRYRLFELRDELRSLKIEAGSKLDHKHFTYLHESVNVTIAFLAHFDIATIVSIEREFQNDSDLRRRVEARTKILDDCQFESAKKIRKKCLRIALVAVAINSGGWAYFLAPVAIARLCTSFFKSKAKAITALPEREIERRITTDDNQLGLAG